MQRSIKIKAFRSLPERKSGTGWVRVYTATTPDEFGSKVAEWGAFYLTYETEGRKNFGASYEDALAYLQSK